MPTLDVPVDDTLFVQIGQCDEYFAGNENDEALFDLPLCVRCHLEEARSIMQSVRARPRQFGEV
jgi:hypothetical protein